MNLDYTYKTADDALETAKRYCKRDGKTWIMEDKEGRFHIINPYSKDVERHYTVKLGWTIAMELKNEVQVERKVLPR